MPQTLPSAAARDAARRAAFRPVLLEFLLPWDDPEISRASGIALFDAFASEDKTLHAFPGSHFTVPVDRIDTRFFARQLTRQPAPPASPRPSRGDRPARGSNHA